MKHLGDISKINGAAIEPVDIISFGSPCQDLSMAGLRKGLKHTDNGDEETTRSGLFMEAVRIIKEMRKATNGEYPRFALWENVPGAFSSNKGEDFRIVCEELIKIVEPTASMPPVPKNGWNYADSYIGDGWSLAYRVFDAQYWGVPQRRRRIHLVADFRGGSAREVLFERQGLRGYFAEGRAPWQGAPADAPGGSGANDREGESNGGDRGRQLDAIGFDCYNQALSGDKAITVRCRGDNEHTPCVLEPIPLNTLSISHGSGGDLRRGDGIGAPGEPQFSISCSHPHAVVYCDRASFNQGQNAKYDPQFLTDGTSATLIARGPGAVTYAMQGFGDYKESDQASACKARDYKDATDLVVQPRYIVRRLTPTECARLQGFADWWAYIEPKESLTEEEYRFWLEVRNTHDAINGRDAKDYTEKQILTWYNKLYTDSAEYKMWGNGIALPPALYCLQGITDALNADDTDDWMN
jgi:DNA (cytosine-5)-methyltransferase 1